MIFVLLPAYNEADNIEPLLQTVESEALTFFDTGNPVPVHAVVVNDGSEDGTGSLAQRYTGAIEITVLEHETNRGLAAALQTGIEFILREGREQDWIVTMDADQTHHPRYIFFLLKKLQEGYDIVVASRYAEGGKEVGVSFFRKLLSHGARRIYTLFFPSIPLRDFSCGYRGFSYSLLQQVAETWGDRLFQHGGFACTGELMLKMLVHVPLERITEIPFVLHYEQKGGISKMPKWKTIWETLKLIFHAQKWLREKKS